MSTPRRAAVKPRRKTAAKDGPLTKAAARRTLDASVGKKRAGEASVALRTRGGSEVLVVQVPWGAAAAGLRAVAKSVPAR